MHLIWYNSVERVYEYGSSKVFRTVKEKSDHGEALTILMEFANDDPVLANKVINELNIAKSEPLMVVETMN